MSRTFAHRVGRKPVRKRGCVQTRSRSTLHRPSLPSLQQQRLRNKLLIENAGSLSEQRRLTRQPSTKLYSEVFHSIPHDASAVCDIMLLLGRSLAVKGQTHDSLIQQAIRRGLCRFEFWKARAAGKSTEAASALEASLLDSELPEEFRKARRLAEKRDAQTSGRKPAPKKKGKKGKGEQASPANPK